LILRGGMHEQRHHRDQRGEYGQTNKQKLSPR
jgi:hypothetical protein